MLLLLLFFFNDTATTEIYPLSLHDALPISFSTSSPACSASSTLCWMPRPATITSATSSCCVVVRTTHFPPRVPRDRKSTRLNSSHLVISYAVFCLKKKIHRRARTARASSHP